MSRIPFPDLNNLPPRAREAIDSQSAPLNLVTMSAHSPMLVAPLVSLGTTILSRLTMSPRDREIVILLTGTAARCEYVLAQHRIMAARLGLTETEIEALCAVPTDRSIFAATDLLLIDAVHEVLATYTLEVATLAALQRRFSHAELVEVFYVIGHYRMISPLLNALEVDIDPNGDAYAKLSELRSDAFELPRPRKRKLSHPVQPTAATTSQGET